SILSSYLKTHDPTEIDKYIQSYNDYSREFVEMVLIKLGVASPELFDQYLKFFENDLCDWVIAGLIQYMFYGKYASIDIYDQIFQVTNWHGVHDVLDMSFMNWAKFCKESGDLA